MHGAVGQDKGVDPRPPCDLHVRPTDEEAKANGFKDAQEWYVYSSGGALIGDRAKKKIDSLPPNPAEKSEEVIQGKPSAEAQWWSHVQNPLQEDPDEEAEKKLLFATTGTADAKPEQLLTAKDLIAAQRLVRSVPVGDAVADAILKLVRSGRPDEAGDPYIRNHVAWGPGPRASQALMLATRARALLQGRFAPSIDDVVTLAPPVLRHRMALTFSARADGITVDTIIARLCAPLG